MREGSNVRRHHAGGACFRPDRIPVLRAHAGRRVRTLTSYSECRSEACPDLRIARKLGGRKLDGRKLGGGRRLD